MQATQRIPSRHGHPAWRWAPGCLTLCLWTLGCGGDPRVVRGSEEPGIDTAAFSTGLDRRDLHKMLHDNLQVLWRSPLMRRWQQENRPPVAVLRIDNETSEHIESALDSLISDFENELVNSNRVRVVSLEQQPALMKQVRQQQGSAFDSAEAAQWGKQLGVHYVLRGKVFTMDERAANARRVQYVLFIQVLAVASSEVLFQNKATVTKAVIR
ncbi:MAG: penicillin-binding protein activator LpoB [Polyangiales bacterium]